VIAIAFGLLFANFSSAQVASSSPSSTSSDQSQSATPVVSVQLTSSSSMPPSNPTSTDGAPSSTPSDDLAQLSSSSTTVGSSTPVAVSSASSTSDSTSTTAVTSTSVESSAPGVSSATSPSVDQLSLTALASSSPSSTQSLLSSTSTATSSTVTQPASPPPSPPVPNAYPTCDQSVINVPADYPSIQTAIDAASIGDTVKVAAGTYNEDVSLKSGICLEGAGVDQTIISKSGASGISGNGVSYVIIENLTVEDSGCAPGLCGGGGDGGGVWLSGSNNITLQSCRLTGNTAVNGGGMYLSASTVTMDHCLIDDNTAHNAGGGIIADADSTVALTDVTVANNTWSNALGNGGVGGVDALGASLQIANSILWGNNDTNFSGSGSGVSNSDIGGWSGGTDNVSTNPSFVSTTDYQLQTGSAVVGMGTN